MWYIFATDAKYSWLVGVFLAALASIISNLGLTLQKLTHQRIASGYDRSNKPYYRHALWMVGLSFVIFASIADLVALMFAPQSLVAPLGALTMVSNVVFAPLLLHEKIGMRDMVATGVILTGSVIAVVFGSHEDQIYAITELFGLFRAPAFIAYAFLIVGGICGLLVFLHHFVIAEEAFANGQGPELSPRQRMWQRFAYPALAGTVGAQSVLFAKCSVELVLNTARGNGNAFNYWQTYLIIICMFCTIFLQIHWLNEGLIRFDTSYIVPVFVSFWIVLSVLSGMIFFKEWAGMTWTQIWLFALGVVCTICGVVLLSFRPLPTVASADRGSNIFDALDQNDDYARGGEPYPPVRRLSVDEQRKLQDKVAQHKQQVHAVHVAEQQAASSNGTSNFRQQGGSTQMDSSADDPSLSSRLAQAEEDAADLSDGESEHANLLHSRK